MVRWWIFRKRKRERERDLRSVSYFLVGRIQGFRRRRIPSERIRREGKTAEAQRTECNSATEKETEKKKREKERRRKKKARRKRRRRIARNFQQSRATPFRSAIKS